MIKFLKIIRDDYLLKNTTIAYTNDRSKEILYTIDGKMAFLSPEGKDAILFEIDKNRAVTMTRGDFVTYRNTYKTFRHDDEFFNQEHFAMINEVRNMDKDYRTDKTTYYDVFGKEKHLMNFFCNLFS